MTEGFVLLEYHTILNFNGLKVCDVRKFKAMNDNLLIIKKKIDEETISHYVDKNMSR